jgi:pimeloyl-ACP methyl ester carboxylesterase
VIPGAITRTVDSGDVRLEVAEAGDASRATILLVHGYPDTKDVWTDVVPRLAPRFHLVAYDVRGAGGSTAPRGRAAYDLDRLTDDVLAVLDAVSPERPAHLVGHDWGSIQGWEFATSPRLRGRLASYTSMCGPSLDHIGVWMRDRLRHPTPDRLRALAGQGVRSWYIGALQIPLLPALAWRTVLPRRIPKAMERLEGLRADSGYPGRTLAADGLRGMNLYRRNVPRRVRHPRTDAVAHVPVQLVVPSRDPFVSPRLYDDLDRWVPTLRRRTIDAGHWVPRTEPETIARWIGEFVDDVEGGEGVLS